MKYMASALSDRTEIDLDVGRTVNGPRLERGTTVKALGKGTGISGSIISRPEKGPVSPSLGTLAAAAEALSVPVMALLAETGGKAGFYHPRLHSEAQGFLPLGKHGGPSGDLEAARIRMSHDAAGRLPRYRHEGYVFVKMTSGKTKLHMRPSETLAWRFGNPESRNRIHRGILPTGVMSANDRQKSPAYDRTGQGWPHGGFRGQQMPVRPVQADVSGMRGSDRRTGLPPVRAVPPCEPDA